MEEKKLTERESIELITSMISRTKERYIGDGNILLMWGYLVVAVTITVWILQAATHSREWQWLWFLIPLVGGVATPLMLRNRHLKSGVKTYSDNVTSRLWTIVGISEIVLTVICLALAFLVKVNAWSSMLVYTLLVVPFAELTQGMIVREKCLVYGGVTGLAIGVIFLCSVAGQMALYAHWFLPLFIIAFIAMMIVPGHILNHKAKKR